MTPADSPRRYDVCLSFAGEERSYVEQVADALRKKGVRVFYDAYEQADLWGKDLYDHLDEVYQHEARYCVLFASAAYARKSWTTHERRSAQARALRENSDYVLPARFDDTEIPGLRPTVGYIDLRLMAPGRFAELIAKKVGASEPGTTDSSVFNERDRTGTPSGPMRSDRPAERDVPIWTSAGPPRMFSSPSNSGMAEDNGTLPTVPRSPSVTQVKAPSPSRGRTPVHSPRNASALDAGRALRRLLAAIVMVGFVSVIVIIVVDQVRSNQAHQRDLAAKNAVDQRALESTVRNAAIDCYVALGDGGGTEDAIAQNKHFPCSGVPLTRAGYSDSYWTVISVKGVDSVAASHHDVLLYCESTGSSILHGQSDTFPPRNGVLVRALVGGYAMYEGGKIEPIACRIQSGSKTIRTFQVSPVVDTSHRFEL